MIGSFGGFGGMGLGALGGLSGFAPTPEQIQERLKAAGLGSYTLPAPVAAPRPAPVTPKPTFTPPPLKYDRMGRPIVNKIPDSALPPELRVTPPPPVTPRPQPVAPVMPVGRAYTSIGSNLRSAYTPTAPIAPSPTGTVAKRGDKRAPGAKRPVTTTSPSTPDFSALDDLFTDAPVIYDEVLGAPLPTKPASVKLPPNTLNDLLVFAEEAARKTSPELKSRAPKPTPVTPPSPVASAPLPEGVQSGGRYYKNPVTGDPMYQSPMPKLPDGMMGAQVMPTPINLNTGKPENIGLGDKPAPVTPPNRVGQPVSGGEFIPEPTTLPPKPVTPSTPERSLGLQKRIDDIDAGVTYASSNTPTERAAAYAAPQFAEISQGYRLLGGAVDSYKKKLDEGADYFDIDNVDLVDDFYNASFKDILRTEGGLFSPFDLVGGEATIGGGEMPSDEIRVDRNTYFDKVNAPDYLQDFLLPAKQEDAVAAYSSVGDLQKSSDIASVLSDHYGYEIEPTKQKLGKFGGNLEKHTSSSPQRLAEFNSFIEPILSEQMPYLQMVEGYSYEDALQEAYKRDPMLQALYAKYDVTPLRYTKDGSEYLYDPFTYGEIRTFKADTPNFFEKVIKVVPALLAATVLGPAAASLVGAAGVTGATATALSGALAGAGGTAITGGDTSDILKAALTGGIGGYAKGLDAVASSTALAAEGAAAGSELALAASAAAKTADTFGKVVQGAKFVDAAVDGNIAGAAISAFGPKFTKAAMDKVNLNEEFLSGYNIEQADVVAGLVKTELELAKGTDFGDAIGKGFAEYIMEGGALGPSNVKTPEFIKKIGDTLAESGRMFDDALLQPVKGFVEGTVEVLGDVAEPVVDVIEDVAGAVIEKAPLIEDAVKATGAAVEDVVKPIVDPIIDAAPVVEDAVRAVGSTVDDVIIEPVKELVEEVAPVVEDVVKDVGSAVDDVVLQPAKEVIEGVVEAIPKPSLPDIDLPDLDIPLPDFDVALPTPTFTPTRTPSIVRTPGIIEERGAELFDLGEHREREIDPIDAFLASLAGSCMANGGAVRSSYGNLDELLRIVGGK